MKIKLTKHSSFFELFFFVKLESKVDIKGINLSGFLSVFKDDHLVHVPTSP